MVLARHKQITPGRKSREVLWQWDEEKKDIFVTCPGCGRISRIRSPNVYPSGEVTNCVVCSRCSSHFTLHLHEWDGPAYYCCDGCYRERRSKKFPRGWRGASSPHSIGIYCPKCIREGW